jgi:hypothetical protein
MEKIIPLTCTYDTPAQQGAEADVAKQSATPLSFSLGRPSMNIDWSTFWSALAGTPLPAFVASLVTLYFTYRTNRALEAHKNDLTRRLSVLENDLKTEAAMFSVWHQRRVDALAAIYEAFRAYLDFLRRKLYLPDPRLSLDPMWEFRSIVEKNLVYLNDSLQHDIQRFSAELLDFWNWAHHQNRPGGIDDADPVQKRLDYEIPAYLERLRCVINSYADPHFQIEQQKAQQSASPNGGPASLSRNSGVREGPPSVSDASRHHIHIL